MSKLVICLAFSANDAVQAERLLDFIYRLHGRKQVGHIALISNADCHAEMRAKIRVTAELAFESVTEAVAPQVAERFLTSKFHQLNNLFRKAASVAQTNFKWPWLWLEPDCVPVDPDWISRLATAYDQQPKKYMGLVSKNSEGKQLMARVGVYYGGASYELDSLCQSDVPFPLATAERVIPSSSKSDLVDYVAIETVEDLAKISKEAVVVHGDKMGLFAENWVAPPDYGSGPQYPYHPGMMAETNPAPRQTRRQKAEALDKKHRLDCVATNGAKSSTTVQDV